MPASTQPPEPLHAADSIHDAHAALDRYRARVKRDIQRDIVLRMHARGYSMAHIGEAVGYTRQNVYLIIKKNGALESAPETASTA